MQVPNDWQLLDEYTATGSHAAFEELVQRHAGWIYAAALRRVRSADMADDVTQATFIVLLRKGPCIGRRESLAAWLYRVVQYVAIDAQRRQGSRRRHERQAAKSEIAGMADDRQEVIENLDAALDDLNRRDREAIILRYFNDQTLEQIGRAQRVATSTVQRRLDKSLSRIAYQLKRKGITAASATLGSTLTAVGTIVAPRSSTHGITALATAAAALPATTAGPIGLAHGAIKTVTLIKIKIAAAMLVAFTLLGTGGAIVTHYAMAEATRHAATASPNTPPSVQVAAATMPAAAPLPNSDADFIKQFKPEWEAINLQYTNVNPNSAYAKQGRVSSQSLQVEVNVNILDTSHLLGFDRLWNFTVTRILDQAGNDVTADLAKRPQDMHWYEPLPYTQQAGRNGISEVLGPQQVPVFFNVGPRLPRALKLIEGYIWVLTFDHSKQIDLPFVARGTPVEVLPGVSVHFDSVYQDKSTYQYAMAMDAKKRGGFFGLGGSTPPIFNGQLRPGQSLPQEMVMDEYWVDAQAKRMGGQHHPTFMFTSLAASGSGGLETEDKIAAMRFEIATGLAERKLPIRFTDIEVPNQPAGDPKR